MEKDLGFFIYLTIGFIGELFTLFWIYVIITKSPAEMRNYKFWLLKLSICDFIFAILVTDGMLFEVLLPLPAAVIKGFFSHWGNTGVIVGLCASMTSGMTVFTAINDCCYARSLIVFNKEDALKFFHSASGITVVILINIALSLILTPCLLMSLFEPSDFLEYVRRENQSQYLLSYRNQNDVVILAMNRQSVQVVPIITVVVGGCALFQVGNLLSAYFVLRKIRESRAFLSEKTFKQQKQLTIMLILQNIYPSIAIILPLAAAAVCGVFGATTQAISSLPFFRHIIFILIMMYPMASCAFSFIFIQPYRKFLLSLLPWNYYWMRGAYTAEVTVSDARQQTFYS